MLACLGAGYLAHAAIGGHFPRPATRVSRRSTEIQAARLDKDSTACPLVCEGAAYAHHLFTRPHDPMTETATTRAAMWESTTALFSHSATAHAQLAKLTGTSGDTVCSHPIALAKQAGATPEQANTTIRHVLAVHGWADEPGALAASSASAVCPPTPVPGMTPPAMSPPTTAPPIHAMAWAALRAQAQANRDQALANYDTARALMMATRAQCDPYACALLADGLHCWHNDA